MSTYVLIPGAGGQAWYWHRVEPLLRAQGHDVVAVELPADDETAGLQQYTDTVVEATGEGRDDVVVVGQSMGGFTAPLAAVRLGARRIVLVNAMIARPGETAGAWWDTVGQSEAARAMAIREGRDPDADFDLVEGFFHDVPDDITAQAMAGGKEQAGRPFEDPWPLDAWPDLPTAVLAGVDDRLFPVELQDRVARARLGITPVHLPGGHLIALSRPEELTRAILTEG
jgi:pimeloyl-ACP methyl ester carboxylesterase